LAKAISGFFGEVNSENNITDFKSETSKGVSAKAGQDVYGIGTAKWLTSMELVMDDPLMEESSKALEESAIAVFVAKNSELIALFKIADLIKATSKQAIQELKKMGIAIHTLTGDQNKTPLGWPKKPLFTRSSEFRLTQASCILHSYPSDKPRVVN